MNNTKKAVILARVSTKRQEEEGLSLNDIQLPSLKKYAAEKGFEVPDSAVFVFQESADQKIRNKFNEMLNYVKRNKEIKAIIAFRVDRITRNYRDAVAIDDLRKKYDVELHFINDGIVISKDTYGTQIQNWDMHLFIAKQKINRLKEDAFNTIQSKLANGELPGKAPFGYENYQIGKSKKKWVKPDPVKSLILIKIFDWYASGNYSYREVSKKVKNEFNVHLPSNSIQQIIVNNFYNGVIEHSGQRVTHNYQLVIKDEIFEKVQEIRASRSGNKKRRKMKGKNDENVYRGLLFCHKCGAAITPDPKQKKLKNGDVKLHRYYHCTNHFRVHENIININQDKIDDQFVEVFIKMKMPHDKVEMVANRLEACHAQNQALYRQQYIYISNELGKIKAGIKTAYRDYARGSITEEHYSDFVAESKQEQDSVEKKLRKLERLEQEYYLTTAHLVRLSNRLDDIFRRSIMHEKRAILNFAFSNLTLDSKIVRYDLKYPFNEVLKYAPHSGWLPD